MKVTGSYIKDVLTCPQLATFRHIDMVGPSYGATPAMVLGTLFHKAMEVKRMGGDWKAAVQEIPLPKVDKWAQEVAREWWKLEQVVEAWQDPPDWEGMVTIGTELALTSGYYQGRLDALVKLDGEYWSLQYKTCGNATPVSNIVANLRHGWHENLYQWLAVRNGYTPFAGTLAVIVKRLSNKAIKEGTIEPVHIEYIPRQWVHVVETVTDMGRMLGRNGIVSTDDYKPLTPYKNPDACLARGRCPFYSVCWEGGDIRDGEFVQLEPRY